MSNVTKNAKPSPKPAAVAPTERPAAKPAPKSPPAPRIAPAANVAATAKAKPGAKREARGKAKPAKSTTGGKMSGLDAAAKILADSRKAMNCKEIVDAARSKGLWSSGGKTPAATIYAAIIREIAAKKKDARFKKTERGMFVAAPGKGA